MTKLDALNIMMNAIGSTPITNTDSPQNADAIIAKATLDLTVKEIQAEKWWFNTEPGFTLTPNAENKINIPAGIIHIDFTGRHGEHRNLAIRGEYLYDIDNHTFKFDGPVTANVRLCLTFEEIPETAKLYATARAARRFQDQVLCDTNAHSWTELDEATARAKLTAEDIRQTKPHYGIYPRLDPNVGIDLRFM